MSRNKKIKNAASYAALIVLSFIWLLPIAWCKHVLHGIFVVTGKGAQRADNAKANREERKILRDRAALLKQLRMM